MSNKELKELMSIICEGQDSGQRRKVENFIEYQVQLIDSLDKEIERLNNIINEFMDELKWQRKVSLSLNEAFAVSRIDTLINKLQELKGSDKE